MPRSIGLESAEEALGVAFRDRALLRSAFTHGSYLNESHGEAPESNERLEFLGDGVIGLAVAQELYQRYPDRQEGELTALRSELVRGETLARVARALELGRYLVMGRGEEAGGGRDRTSNLAATFEALVGALFLDQGYDGASSFVLASLASEIEDAPPGPAPKSSKSLLQELLQGQGLAAPSYRISETSGLDHARRFTAEALSEGRVIGRGAGPRKSSAEQEAAAEALKRRHPGTE
jgi:ribonuclease-3